MVYYTIIWKDVNMFKRFTPQVATKNIQKGFTLAEILTVIALIGVVSALVIPSFVGNSNKKALQLAQDVEKKDLVEAVNKMRLLNQLSGYSTNDAFADKLQTYIKVQKRCTPANMSECFAKSFKLVDGTIVDIAELTTGSKIGQSKSTSPLVGMVLLNGTTVLLAFNPSCNDMVDPFAGSNSMTSCLSILYDANGLKGPNEVTSGVTETGKDIVGQNFSLTLEPLPFIDVDGVLVDLVDTPYVKDGDYTPSWGPPEEPNMWAGAMKACATKGMSLPTLDQLNKIYLNRASIDGLVPNKNYWSSQEGTTTGEAWLQYFGDGSQDPDGKQRSCKVRCVK